MVGNANSGNPNAAANATTGFGLPGGADPVTAGRKGGLMKRPTPEGKASVRASLKDLAKARLPENWADLSEDDLMRELLPTKTPTAAQLNAARQHAMAIMGNERMAEHVTDNVDGKLPTANLNAEFDDLKNLKDEDLDELTIQLLEQLGVYSGGAGEAEQGTDAPDGGAQHDTGVAGSGESPAGAGAVSTVIPAESL